MRNIYENGRVYIWQNQRAPYEWLNGMETKVIGGIDIKTYQITGRIGHQTDTMGRITGKPILAERGDLRPKDPPPGEKSISDLFKLPQLETA